MTDKTTNKKTYDEILQSELESAFLPRDSDAKIGVINDSQKHRGHLGDNGTGQSHYTVIVISKVFKGLKPVERQREVLKPIQKYVGGTKIHALSIQCKIPKD